MQRRLFPQPTLLNNIKGKYHRKPVWGSSTLFFLDQQYSIHVQTSRQVQDSSAFLHIVCEKNATFDVLCDDDGYFRMVEDFQVDNADQVCSFCSLKKLVWSSYKLNIYQTISVLPTSQKPSRFSIMNLIVINTSKLRVILCLVL